MATRKLEKSEWRQTFDTLSRILGPKQVEVEVAGLPLGDQIVAEWVPLDGVVYDPKDDVAELALEGIDHLISHPREIWIDDEDGVLSRLEIVDAEGTRHIVYFRDPLMLPAA